MPEAQDVSGSLRAAFAKVHAERMDGVPILNPRLEVEVLGMRAWSGHWLSVLITPWFINLMLLPATPEAGEACCGLALGSSVPYRFPAGRFDFLVGEEAGLGRYQMCSLFSPVLEFENQEAARIAGQAALEALFDAGVDESAAKDETAPADPAARQSRAPGQPAAAVSRRSLLIGKLASEKGPV